MLLCVGDGHFNDCAVGRCTDVWLLSWSCCSHSNQHCHPKVPKHAVACMLWHPGTVNYVCIFRVSFQERILAVNQFMKEHHMGSGLIKRVNCYLALLWKQYRFENQAYSKS